MNTINIGAQDFTYWKSDKRWLIAKLFWVIDEDKKERIKSDFKSIFKNKEIKILLKKSDFEKRSFWIDNFFIKLEIDNENNVILSLTENTDPAPYQKSFGLDNIDFLSESDLKRLDKIHRCLWWSVEKISSKIIKDLDKWNQIYDKADKNMKNFLKFFDNQNIRNELKDNPISIKCPFGKYDINIFLNNKNKIVIKFTDNYFDMYAETEEDWLINLNKIDIKRIDYLFRKIWFDTNKNSKELESIITSLMVKK